MKKIIIVEDDPKIATALAIRLRANGYDVSVAPDAIVGLSLARTTKPDLILLDICIPAGNGFQLAENLRRTPQTNGTPIIFITALKNPALQQKAVELGAVGLFEKPFDTEKLIGRINEELSGGTSPANGQEGNVPQATALRSGNILVIEDDRKIAMALTLRLKSAGYEATTAYDALAGVNAAVNSPTDLVLLDISLPAGNGFAVAEKIQALARTPIPIIFITASKQPGFRQKAQELGAAGYFEKPYEAEELLATIHSTLHPPDH